MLKLEPGPYLRERTTLRLGGKTLGEARLSREDELAELPGLLKSFGAAPLVLGRGSNILALDEDLPLVLVTPDFDAPPEIVEDSGGEVQVKVGAGRTLPGFLHWCAENGLGGLAGLAGIPGSMGGAVAMNAGSYGCETGERLAGVRVFTPERGTVFLPKTDFQLAYRKFNPTAKGEAAPAWFVISEALFSLRREEPEAIKALMAENLRKKAATQPISAASAGCVFKNPAPGVSAGKLLDDAGFKGRRAGRMMFSELHANFLINTGGGTSKQALDLLDEARESVLAKFGYNLELEVKVIHGS